MSWVYRFKERALKQVGKLDQETQRRIFAFLDERLAGTEDPRQWGKPLKGELRGIWRYRVGDYRLLCELQDTVMVVLVVRVENRRSVYD
ncbi:MAG: type II toxin-antitoxin system RelE family toxin [Opitutales bacterium]